MFMYSIMSSTSLSRFVVLLFYYLLLGNVLVGVSSSRFGKNYRTYLRNREAAAPQRYYIGLATTSLSKSVLSVTTVKCMLFFLKIQQFGEIFCYHFRYMQNCSSCRNFISTIHVVIICLIISNFVKNASLDTNEIPFSPATSPMMIFSY